MIFAYIILFTAIMLSAVAAYYSIAGLTAIFAAAVLPVIIMGGTLELGKVVATVWLHNNWKRINWAYKSYLLPAIVFLMLLTSMGIFGFLSKAHSDQSLVSGDAMSKVAIFDEKIATEKDNIAQSKKALEQMNQQVDQMLGRSDTERGAERAVSIRKNQAKERAALQAEITKSQKIIQKLQEERAPLAAEFRKVEAEVGPIKYIAALLYGDNPDQNILERAVRWVIILIVIVFDPLALCLILAGNKQMEWAREDKEKAKMDAVADDVAAMNINAEPAGVQIRPWTEEEIEALNSYDPNAKKANEEIAKIETEEPVIDIPEEVAEEVIEEPVQEPVQVAVEEKPIEEEIQEILASNNVITTTDDVQVGGTENVLHFDNLLKEAATSTKQPFVRVQDSEYVEFEGKRMHERVLRSLHPEFFGGLEADNESNNGFGSTFPEYAVMGDLFIRTDVLPNRVFKFNSSKWIEINKEHSDSYLNNNKYLSYLVDKISTGEVDPEILTVAEQDCVANFIRNPKA
jgi:hypothetical protein